VCGAVHTTVLFKILLLASSFSVSRLNTFTNVLRNVLPALLTVCHGLLVERYSATTKLPFSVAHRRGVLPRSFCLEVLSPLSTRKRTYNNQAKEQKVAKIEMQ
jgi:hypothetical protein